jgi:hypothetical protein
MITHEEVLSDHVDILCGRTKVSFSHLGNRRFRFLAAINVERYTEAGAGRKGKSLVVQSIYNAVREAGGRFLTKQRKDDTFFVEVSEVVAREKISHALRDKLPADHLNAVKAKLLRETSCSRRYGDEIFVAANARILRVDLPDRLQSMAVPQNRQCDDRVDQILADELDTFCNQQAAERMRRIQEPTLNLSYTYGVPSRGLHDAHQMVLLRNSAVAVSTSKLRFVYNKNSAALAAAQSYHSANFNASFWRGATTAASPRSSPDDALVSDAAEVTAPAVIKTTSAPISAPSSWTTAAKQSGPCSPAGSEDIFCRQSLDDFGKMHDDNFQHELDDALSDFECLVDGINTEFADEDCFKELGDVLDFLATVI